MDNDKLKYGIVGLLIGGAIVWFLTYSAVNSKNSGMMRMMGVRTNNQTMMQSSQSIDAHFIEQMIPHHEDAITMAEVALEKAQHPEIRNLAQNIIKSQKAENEQMKNWYKEWFGTDVPKDTTVMGQHSMMQRNGMHMGIMGDETDIEALRNVSDFDKEFIEQMIPHHQMAVMMAQMLKNGTQRSEMKQLADDIISAQTREIDQMRQWLNDWEK